MKLAIILGTRPEIIKMSPVIRVCEKNKLDYFILHTGQHYSYNMDKVFFEQLELPVARYNLDVGSGNHGEQTGKILAGIEEVLIKERPDVVLVQGIPILCWQGHWLLPSFRLRLGMWKPGFEVMTTACLKRLIGCLLIIALIIFLLRLKRQGIYCSGRGF